MTPIENPLLLTLLSLTGAFAGQVGFAVIRRNLQGLRDMHYWLNDPSIWRMTSERNLRQLSKLCLPGPLILLGGLPQALALALSLTTLAIGLCSSWWYLIILPVVYVGAEVVSSAGLRCFARARLERIAKEMPTENQS